MGFCLAKRARFAGIRLLMISGQVSSRLVLCSGSGVVWVLVGGFAPLRHHRRQSATAYLLLYMHCTSWSTAQQASLVGWLSCSEKTPSLPVWQQAASTVFNSSNSPAATQFGLRRIGSIRQVGNHVSVERTSTRTDRGRAMQTSHFHSNRTHDHLLFPSIA